MKLSRTVAYGIQATIQLAQCDSGVPVRCSQLAADGRMPNRFLTQVLRHLVKSGILRSTRGVAGGFAMDRRPEDISLLDVIEAIDGTFTSGIPDSSDADSSPGEMRLRQVIDQVTSSSRRQLQSITLADLIGARPFAKWA